MTIRTAGAGEADARDYLKHLLPNYTTAGWDAADVCGELGTGARNRRVLIRIEITCCYKYIVKLLIVIDDHCEDF